MISKNAALALLAAAALLTGCGGGGVVAGAVADTNNSSSSAPSTAASGSGTGTGTGTGAGTGTGTGTGTQTSAMKLQLADAAGNPVTVPTLSPTVERTIKVTAPNLAPYRRVDVTLENGLAVLTPQSGSLLTNASGVALLTIAPASASSSGAIRVSATVGADGGNVSASLDLQVVAGSVALGAVSTTPASVQVGQSVTVSVDATVDGAAARANSLAVTFSSACGTVEPATATVDATGRASAVIQTKTTGACSVSATTTGLATASKAAYTVTNLPAFGLNFVKAEPQVIYFKESVGPRSSNVTFKVVDAAGNPIAGQKVNASLPNAADVDFCGVSAPSATSGPNGEVVFPVCSGYQPTSVQVRAVLDGTAIGTDSNLLTVQSGMPSQRFFDLVSDKLNFHAGGYFTDTFSGLSVSLTVFAADRQGNPVPNGTPVIFVSEGGQINAGGQASCVINAGRCSVSLIGQEYRPLGSPVGDPRPGRVTVLAMADGEESFFDANNNNRYDAGEPFEDLGRPFLDKDEDGVYTAQYVDRVTGKPGDLVTGAPNGDTAFPMSSEAEGGLACDPSYANVGLSVANTCNTQWNGYGKRADGTAYVPTKVRRRVVVIFSGGAIGYPNAQKAGSCTHSFVAGSYDATIPASAQTEVLTCSRTGLLVRLADRNGNPLPADASLSLTVRKVKSDSACAAALAGGVTAVGNSTEPTQHGITLTTCTAGDVIDITAKTADGTVTSTFSVTVP